MFSTKTCTHKYTGARETGVNSVFLGKADLGFHERTTLLGVDEVNESPSTTHGGN